MHIHTMDAKSAHEKKLLYLHLVNELEDHMDHALEYTIHSRRTRRNEEYFRCCLQLAIQLQHTALANEMQLLLDAPVRVEDFLCWDHSQGYELRASQWQRSPLEAGMALLRCWKHKLTNGTRQGVWLETISAPHYLSCFFQGQIIYYEKSPEFLTQVPGIKPLLTRGETT